MSNQLSNSAFHILLSLAVGERHGYAIMKDVEAQTDGEISMGPGTLYTSLKKLLTSGLIEEGGERPDPQMDDQRRRYYKLTAKGVRAAQADADRILRLAQTIRRRLVEAGL